MSKKNGLRITKKYYFEKNGVIEGPAYDYIRDRTIHKKLYVVELNGKMGFANLKGRLIIPIIYDIKKTSFDSDKYLDLSIDGKWGMIKYDGDAVVNFEWDALRAYQLSEGFIPVKKGNKWGFVNVSTGRVVKPIYDDVSAFVDGFAIVTKNNHIGMIDKKGNMVIECKYNVLGCFLADFAIAAIGNDYKVLNKKGNEVASGYSMILVEGINTFSMKRNSVGVTDINLKKDFIRQYIPFDDFIVVIDDAKYDGKYIDGKWYSSAIYRSGGIFSAIDYEGNEMHVENKIYEEVRKTLLSESS